MADGRNYQRKGDAFSEQVRRGEGPPCVQQWANRSTGRVYFTRVPVDRCTQIKASDTAAKLRELQADRPSLEGLSMAALAERFVLTVNFGNRTGTLDRIELPQTNPAEVRLSFTVTQTGTPAARGTRLWLICPRCSRRCGKVYGSRWGKWGAEAVSVATGCRTCLGLTDQSRQRHKTLDWATAVMGDRVYKADPSGVYRSRSWLTVHKAHLIFNASFARAFRGMGWPLPGDEKAPSR